MGAHGRIGEVERWALRILSSVLIVVGSLFGLSSDSLAQTVVRSRWEQATVAHGRFLPVQLTRGPGRWPALDVAASTNPWRIAGQLAGGIVGASVVGLMAWRHWDDPYGPGRRVKGDAGYTPDANTAYAVGSFVGSTLLVYWIGRGDGSHASFWATALGTGLASVPLFLGRQEPYLPIFGIALGAPLQALGGVIGYTWTRRPKAAR